MYFNKGVKALDAADIGHVVRETMDKIIVFGQKEARYDIPISEIQQVGAKVLIGLCMSEIVDRFKVKRKEPLPHGRSKSWPSEAADIDLATYEGKYPRSLFNKGVRAFNEDDLGHIVKETNDKIIVFGSSNARYDISKSHIIAVGRNVILNIDFPEIHKYQVTRSSSLPTDVQAEQEEKEEVYGDANDADDAEQEKEQQTNTEGMSDEDFHKYYHGPKEEEVPKQKTTHKEQSGQLFDLQTIFTQRQDRLREALEERYQYNTSIKRGQDFLLKHVSSKTPLVVMFVDLVGSTNMSMTLPAEKTCYNNDCVLT